MMSADCLQNLFAELRLDMPGLPVLISDADARTTWLEAMKQVIRAMPRGQQYSALVDVSHDLQARCYPSLPSSMLFCWLCGQFGMGGADDVEREG
jgi:hypothetical protein